MLPGRTSIFLLYRNTSFYLSQVIVAVKDGLSKTERKNYTLQDTYNSVKTVKIIKNL